MSSVRTSSDPLLRARAVRRLQFSPALVAALATAVLAVASFLVIPPEVGFDPWNWLIWGREIAHGYLDTQGGTSWKPLPVVATLPLSVTGSAAPYLWLGLERWAALAGFLGVYELGHRLSGRVAGLLAVLLTAGLGFAVLWFAGGTAEWPLVGVVAWAIVAELQGQPRAALALWYLAALLEPTTWPFLLAAMTLVFVREPRWRLPVIGLALLLPVVWFVPEWWGSGTLGGGAAKALSSPAAAIVQHAAHPWRIVVHRWNGLVPIWLEALAALAVVLGLMRRRRVELVLGVLITIWVAVVAVMAEAGYASTPRFLLPAAMLAMTLAGTGIANGTRAVASGLPAAPVVQAVLVLAALAPLGSWFRAREQRLRHDHAKAAFAATNQAELGEAIVKAGGSERLLACGTAYTYQYRVPPVLWSLDPPAGMRPARGIVVLRARAAPAGDFLPRIAVGTPPLMPIVRNRGWDIRVNCSTKARVSAPSWYRVGVSAGGTR